MFSRILSDEQIKRIDQASLTILERIGVVVPHEEILSRFAAVGAKVDRASQRVRIPAELVRRQLASATKQYTLYGRDLAKTAKFGQGTRNYNSSAGQALWVDQVGGPRRYPNMADAMTATRFSDALPLLNIPGPMADPHELPVSYRCVELMAEMLKNTAKPINFWFHDRASAKYLNELTVALRGDEKKAMQYPVAFDLLEPISPLRFPVNGIDLLFETAKLNLPVHVGPIAQMGLSAAGTMAGIMAQENAEVLAGVCITQLVRPGMPVCYGGVCHAFDMATTQVIFGGPEQAIFGVAMTQMGKHYGLPVYVNVGLTDSKRVDAQAGLEVGMTLMLTAAAGADIFGHLGICGADQGGSLETLMMQHEIVSYVESVMREIEFSDDTFALDVLEQVGPGGNFIDQDHTAEHFRRELWFPKLLDRNFYQAWADAGASSMEDRCRQGVKDILHSHTPEPIDPALAKEFDKIVAAAKKELGN